MFSLRQWSSDWLYASLSDNSPLTSFPEFDLFRLQFTPQAAALQIPLKHPSASITPLTGHGTLESRVYGVHSLSFHLH